VIGAGTLAVSGGGIGGTRVLWHRLSPRVPFPESSGVLTAAYGAAIVVSPRILAKPCALARVGGGVRPEVATVIRAVGVRDTASGLFLALAPRGAALRGAVAVRGFSDFGDAVVFGFALPDTASRVKVAGLAAVWGVLCGYSGRRTG